MSLLHLLFPFTLLFSSPLCDVSAHQHVLSSYGRFDTPDLFEQRNMKAVIQNIHALARTARGLPPGTFNGPFLATKAPVVTL